MTAGFTRPPLLSRLSLSSLVILTLLTFSLVRLAGLEADASLHSLQMDFAAFHTAGTAVGAGLSPYRNHVDHVPRIWDGISEYTHSRFLYPPLVATLIRPLAFLPFRLAKTLWNAFSMLCIMSAVVLSARHLKLPALRIALVIGLVGLFHPLLTEIERGQIDGIILLLITGAIIALDRGSRPAGIAAGALLACATLLKLHCLFFLPFLVLRRKWDALAGFGAAGALLVVASLLVNGPQSLGGYLFTELPRIARYGEGGDASMKLGSATLDSLRDGASPNGVVKEGRLYAGELFAFRTNASFVRAGDFLLDKAGMKNVNATLTSGVVLLSLIVIFALYHPGFLLASSLPRRADFLYWLIVLVVILMAGPLTWSMNLVWLLLAIVIAVDAVPRLAVNGPFAEAEGVSLYLLVLGLALAGMPDDRSFPMWLPLATPLFAGKYVAAELLVFAGLLGYSKHGLTDCEVKTAR